MTALIPASKYCRTLGKTRIVASVCHLWLLYKMAKVFARGLTHGQRDCHDHCHHDNDKLRLA